MSVETPIRVLWTSNIVLPAVASELGLTETPFGGWLTLTTSQLARHGGFAIGVAMRADVESLRCIEKDGITYFALPQSSSDRFDLSQADVEHVLQAFSPDILHVEGGEMRHARRFLGAWKGPRLVSMQGVLNGYAPYELGGLPILSMLNPLRPRIALTALALLVNRSLRFSPRLAHERAVMSMATDVMGRTLWDSAQAAALVPQARYHHCPRILRDSFYRTAWRGNEACEQHSIFIGNSASPRKGAHIALRALALLKRNYPDIKLYIAGEDPQKLPKRSLKRYVGYPVYLRYLISSFGLGRNVEFTGVLSEADMVERMAKSHIFLMPSIIENSPNTLGEAMMLGLPCVSAYAGGAPSMAVDEHEALFYRPDDPAMLAHQVGRIFADDTLAQKLSESAQVRAKVTHAPEAIIGVLVKAYESILRSARQAQ